MNYIKLYIQFKSDCMSLTERQGGVTKKEARRRFDLFIETLMDYMSEDKKVVFTGFGRFEMKTFKERKGRNPLGGAECIVPEHRKMKFYASEVLIDKIESRLD